MKGRTGTRNDGKIVITSLVYKNTPDSERNFKEIVDLILGVDTGNIDGYTSQPPATRGDTRSSQQ